MPISNPTATPTPGTPTPTPPTPTLAATPFSTTQPSPISISTQPTPRPTDSSYTHLSYAGYTQITWDGKWTTNNEWADAGPVSTSANVSFRDKIILIFTSNLSSIWENILIETSDNTTDLSDYWEICIDGMGDGGNTPQPDDFKIVILGHTNETWYRGNGTTWVPISVPPAEYFKWNNSIHTSPANNENHWICELGLERVGLSISPTFYMRVAVYDGQDGGFGLQSWPPTSSANSPNDWGFIDIIMML